MGVLDRVKTIFVFLSLGVMIATAPLQARAASAEDGPGPSSGPRRHLATIIYSGLGGAVLGLSTLSFYGRPQDKLGNIGVGFAVGIIAGTAYVTYQMVKSPGEFYGQNGSLNEWPQPDPNDHRLWMEPGDRTFFESPRAQSAATAPSLAQLNWATAF